MDITTRSTMAITDHGKEYRFRTEEDMLRIIRLVTNHGPSVLYSNSCGFLPLISAEEYLQAMLADQELFNKHSGMLIRVNDVVVEKSDLNYGREHQELKMIADSMAAYYAVSAGRK